jgi:hypothetical protein
MGRLANLSGGQFFHLNDLSIKINNLKNPNSIISYKSYT